MASATTKTLRILVEASGAAAAARQIAAVDRSVQNLGKSSKAYKVGAGIGNVIKSSVILGTVAAGAVATYMAVAIKDGQEAARVQQILETAIRNSGKVSQEQAVALGAQSKSLMMLAGVDDEAIKAEQTRLIQMGLTGAQVEKLTPLIMDMSKATGRDLLTSTLAVGKAVNGTTTGLQRFGIFVDKAKAKTDPFGATVEALTAKFGGTTQALSGSFETRMAAFRLGIGEIGEDIGIRMLPALTRMADVMGRVVVPAFQKFVDRVMPDIERGMEQFASMLEGGGAAKGIDAIYTSVSALVDLLKIAAEPIKMIVGAFMALPKEVQTVLVAGFAVNKLSGGMFGSVAGDLLKSGIKGVLGIQAGVVNINAGVVNGPGGKLPVPGGAVPLGAAPVAGAIPAAAGVAGLGTIASIAAPLLLLAIAGGLSPGSRNKLGGVGTPGHLTAQQAGLYTKAGGYRGGGGSLGGTTVGNFGRSAPMGIAGETMKYELRAQQNAMVAASDRTTRAILDLPRQLQGALRITIPTPRDYSRGVKSVTSWSGSSRLSPGVR